MILYGALSQRQSRTQKPFFIPFFSQRFRLCLFFCVWFPPHLTYSFLKPACVIRHAKRSGNRLKKHRVRTSSSRISTTLHYTIYLNKLVGKATLRIRHVPPSIIAHYINRPSLWLRECFE